ncbi:MAG TPA: hypothetical protein VFX61_06370 [Micromonosporaceae bacterium]|nr:hypothetical protein [Micromonosporaceae bacterium]
MSGPPMSGPPVGAAPGMPYGAFPPAAPPKGRAALVLTIVAVLLFVLGGVMTGLYLAKSNELNSTRNDLTAQIAERDDTIGAQEKEIGELKRDVETAKDKIDSVEQNLKGTENQRDELERQKQVISKCLNLLGEAGAAANAGNRSAYEKAMKEADKVCDEADRYL